MKFLSGSVTVERTGPGVFSVTVEAGEDQPAVGTPGRESLEAATQAAIANAVASATAVLIERDRGSGVDEVLKTADDITRMAAELGHDPFTVEFPPYTPWDVIREVVGVMEANSVSPKQSDASVMAQAKDVLAGLLRLYGEHTKKTP